MNGQEKNAFRPIEKLHEGDSYEVWRAIRRADGKPVILKIPGTENACLNYEYDILKGLSHPAVIRVLGPARQEGKMVLVFEDIGGTPLARGMKKKRPTPRECLDIARQIADALEFLHGLDIVHQRINPSHIIWNRRNGALRLTGFGTARIPGRDSPRPFHPLGDKNSLPYISPEQTGRTDREIDFRSDFYSLGVTLFQLLTGRLPFASDDPQELVYSHIALTPPDPREINSKIPRALADILARLLEKNAEDRYQSAHGLKTDLEKCLRRLARDPADPLDHFDIGADDRPEKFTIPQKMYGRKKELQKIIKAFGEVRGGKKQLLAVSGPPGIGKTLLAQQLREHVLRERGHMIMGKYNQLSVNRPYSALIQAFQQLIHLVLTLPADDVDRWRQKITTAVGADGELVTTVIPGLQDILGPGTPVPPMDPDKAQNRFQMVFQAFISVFCDPQQPLVLFLDDLQWVDPASLTLMEYLMTTPDIKYLFFVAAYRDNEVTENHPLNHFLQKIKSAGGTVRSLHLRHLDKKNVNHLLADSLHTHPAKTNDLSAICFQKTRGNPFFLVRYLLFLVEQNQLRFRRDRRRWEWDANTIGALGVPGDVVDFMVERLRELPQEGRRLLEIAACIGNRFSLDTLAIVCDKEKKETQVHLQDALSAGLVVRPDSTGEFRFAHDRIQQAAYRLTGDDAAREQLHLTIGHLLLREWERGGEEKVELFDIVNHLNQGVRWMKNPDHRLQLAELNLRVAEKARAAIAYEQARQYLAAGTALLPADSWEKHYELAFRLFKERGEMEILTGGPGAEAITRLVLQKTRTILQKAEIHNSLIILYTLQGEYQRVLNVGTETLKMLDIHLSADFTGGAAGEVAELRQRIKTQTRGGAVSALLSLPVMTAADKIMAMNILMNMQASAFYVNRPLFAAISLEIVRLSLAYGNAPESASGYYCFGIMVNELTGDYKAGYAFGRLALAIADRFDDPAQKCKACNGMANFLLPWIEHLRGGETLNLEGYHAGLKSGELLYGGYCIGNQAFLFYFQGRDLPFVLGEISNHQEFLEKSRNLLMNNSFISFQLAVAPLVDGRGIPRTKMREDNYLKAFHETNSFSALFFYHLVKAQVEYLLGNPGAAWEQIIKTEKHLDCVRGYYGLAEYGFYRSLILAALYPDVADTAVKQQYCDEMRADRDKIKTHADDCPENFRHKYLLIDAEMARIQGKFVEAAGLYDEAAQSAAENGFIQYAALADELAGRLWMQRGREKIARGYLAGARDGYRRWGATRKVCLMERQFPFLEVRATPREKNTETGTVGDFDAHTLIKAVNILTGEMDKTKLLEKMMNIVLENAAARKAVLLLKDEKGEKFHVAAVIPPPPGNGDADGGHSGTDGGLFSDGVVRYVERTGQALLLNDAWKDGRFASDAYLGEHRPRSVLCIPLVRQEQATGILYLENNLTVGAFTEKNISILSMLSTQMAISLENVSLVSRMGELVERRTRQLEEQRDIARDYLDIAGVIIVAIDIEQRVTLVNKKGCRVLGWDENEILGKNWFESFLPPGDVAMAQSIFKKWAIGEIGMPPYYENEIMTRSGEKRLIAWHNTELKDSAGNLRGTLSSGEDITERKQRERQLEESLTEKEVLLKEIHHRVKNNLSVISSLLNLQSHSIANPQVRDALVESQNRIQSMARIHQQLYGSENLAQVDMGYYTNSLWKGLHYSYNIFDVSFEPRVKNVLLPVDAAIPCGLIMNELLSNALKYAFPPDWHGDGKKRISVVLTRDAGDQVKLEVSDNGVGMPPEIEIADSESLGLQLISMLARQLRGTVKSRGKKGTRFTIEFKLSDI